MKTLILALLLSFLCSSSALAGSYGGGSVGAAERKRPNILLITLDDIGWDAFSYSGADNALLSGMSTPNIDALMADGVTFKHGQVQTWCIPTRVELLTGRDQVTTRGNATLAGYDWNTPQVSNYLAASGLYRVYGAGKHGVLMPNGNTWASRTLNVGTTIGGFNNGKLDYDRALFWPKSQQNNGHWCMFPLLWSDEGVDRDGYEGFPGDLTVTQANSLTWGDCSATSTGETVWADNSYNIEGMEYLADHRINHADKSWFMWLSFSAPHVPVALAAGAGTPSAPTDQVPYAGWGGTTLALTCGNDPSSPTSIECFRAMIEHTDTLIGQFLAAIPAAERANTLIILHGDNGSEPFFTGVWIDDHEAANCPGGGCVYADLDNVGTPGLPNTIPGVGKASISHTGTGVPYVVAGGVVSNTNRGSSTLAPTTARDINETILQAAIPGFTRDVNYPAKLTNDMLTPLMKLDCTANPNPCDDIAEYGFTIGALDSSTGTWETTLPVNGRAMLDRAGFKYYENADQLYNLVSDPKQTSPLCSSTCTATPPASGAAVTALAGLKAELTRY